MRKLSRRIALAGGAALGAIPFSAWIQQQAWGKTPRVRHNAYSAEGKAMLKKYEEGVKRMMDTSSTPESDPKSWTFQWFTHNVKSPPGMASEISRIYPKPSAPHRALAEQMWDTCQAHGGQNEDFFLPWHRMYVHYFEMIVRQASHDPDFTLPYWNYSDPAQAALPPEFLVTGSPLHRSNRNHGPNTGAKIPAHLVALTALKDTTYSPNGASGGFCADLDFGLHGNVHVWVGNGQGMGTIPWAANDPIFWMHHCNIDRLWASWNRGNCKNPTDAAWLNQQFTFADIDGKKVVATIKDFDEISKLDYTYDAFEPATCAQPRPLKPIVIAGLAEQVLLARAPLRVNLVSPPARVQTQQMTLNLNDRIRTLEPAASVYVVLHDAHAAAPPGVYYDVYLDLPEGEQPKVDSPNYVDTINFFGVTMMGDNMAKMKPRTFSLNVTKNIKELASKFALGSTLAVTLVPSGEPSENARPSIAQIQLVAQ